MSESRTEAMASQADIPFSDLVDIAYDHVENLLTDWTKCHPRTDTMGAAVTEANQQSLSEHTIKIQAIPFSDAVLADVITDCLIESFDSFQNDNARSEAGSGLTREVRGYPSLLDLLRAQRRERNRRTDDIRFVDSRSDLYDDETFFLCLFDCVVTLGEGLADLVHLATFTMTHNGAIIVTRLSSPAALGRLR